MIETLSSAQRYYRRHRDRILAAQAIKYLATKEERKARYKAYYAKDHDRILERIRKRRIDDPKGVLAKERLKRGQPVPTRECPDVCELCGKPSTHKALHLDHCHETGKFRGWLCAKCNMGIGHLGDNLDGLKAAVKYLEDSK